MTVEAHRRLLSLAAFMLALTAGGELSHPVAAAYLAALAAVAAVLRRAVCVG